MPANECFYLCLALNMSELRILTTPLNVDSSFLKSSKSILIRDEIYRKGYVLLI